MSLLKEQELIIIIVGIPLLVAYYVALMYSHKMDQWQYTNCMLLAVERDNPLSQMAMMGTKSFLMVNKTTRSLN